MNAVESPERIRNRRQERARRKRERLAWAKSRQESRCAPLLEILSQIEALELEAGRIEAAIDRLVALADRMR